VTHPADIDGKRRKHWILASFWAWYERHYLLNLSLTTGLFLLQLVHLYWLFTHVVLFRLLGQSYFDPSPFWQYMIIIVDYTEIPALISTSVLYIYALQKRFSWKTIWFLVSLNSQWLHLFWITDEFVVNRFAADGGSATVLPVWLAWVAILIDFLELPVIIDMIRTLIRELPKKGFVEALREAEERDA
jgi:hypothetical protein